MKVPHTCLLTDITAGLFCCFFLSPALLFAAKSTVTEKTGLCSLQTSRFAHHMPWSKTQEDDRNVQPKASQHCYISDRYVHAWCRRKREKKGK